MLNSCLRRCSSVSFGALNIEYVWLRPFIMGWPDSLTSTYTSVLGSRLSDLNLGLVLLGSMLLTFSLITFFGCPLCIICSIV